MTQQEIYDKLALNDEQLRLMLEFKQLYHKMIIAGLYFVEANDRLYAYNCLGVSCFDAPENAAYDNGKEEVDVTRLQLVSKSRLLNFDNLQNDTTCLVAFEDD